jgi:NAD(P)-dependent dehydrogenase (short-subunit alcohol dehydrogenase family)
MSGSFSGKVVVITGAASGMGKAHAEAFASAGASVIVTDIDQPGGSAVTAAICAAGGSARFVLLDVAEEAQWASLGQSIRESEGQLDVLVHHAGIATIETFAQSSLASFERTFAVNTTSGFLAAKTAHPLMRPDSGASMIFTASVAAQMATAAFFSYGPSKAAVCHLVRTLAVGLAADGIRVNAVLPGTIDTPMSRSAKDNPEIYNSIVARIPMRRIGRPEEVSAAVLFLASQAASFVTGVALPVDGGSLAL